MPDSGAAQDAAPGVEAQRPHEIPAAGWTSVLRRVLPHATWTAAGIGREQARVMDWALARGADAVRTGLEDNIRVAKDRLAGSNAELVSLAVEAIARHGRRPATPAEARALLGLRAEG